MNDMQLSYFDIDTCSGYGGAVCPMISVAGMFERLALVRETGRAIEFFGQPVQPVHWLPEQLDFSRQSIKEQIQRRRLQQVSRTAYYRRRFLNR